MRSRAALLALVLALVGCGGGRSPEEEAQRDWEDHVGPAWAAYEEGYDRGWTAGCEEAADAVRDDDPDRYDEAFYGSGPGCGHDSAPASEVPDVPPDDPGAEGYEDGLAEGCAHVYEAIGEDDPWAACPVTR